MIRAVLRYCSFYLSRSDSREGSMKMWAVSPLASRISRKLQKAFS